MKAQVLLIGTLAQYHQVLNRAVWSPLALAHTLLKLLVQTFTQPAAPLVFGVDPTVERRWGRKIAAPTQQMEVTFVTRLRLDAALHEPTTQSLTHLLRCPCPHAPVPMG